MKLSSTAFVDGVMIPVKYTCDGENISPPLAWSGAPDGTKSFALICDDPDAPAGTWVHWVMYNIPSRAASLPEKVPAADTLPDGTRQGISDFKRPGYGGPCPPGGIHRYFFKMYALDVALPAGTKMTKTKLLAVMEGHVLASAQLMGKYGRR